MLKTNHTYSNEEIAEFLTNIATVYEIKNKSYFRTVSYKNAAESVASHPKSIQKLWSQDPSNLDSIPNIGANIQEKLDYLFKNNQLHPSLIKSFKSIHPAVFTFIKINGIGARVAHKLTTNLKFSSDPAKALNQLVRYAKSGKIKEIETFGDRSEASILTNTLNFLGRTERMSFDQAQKIAQQILDHMKKKYPKLIYIPLGSLRRQSQTVGDIDIAVQSEDTQNILDHFIAYPDSIQTIARGPKKASIRIRHDVRIDLMVQPAKTWGSLLQHFTGSRQHNIELRKYAQSLGYSLSEYGIKDLRTNQVYTFQDEVDFYKFLGLNYIPPQERLGESEIEKYKK
jgi:DNA polymerase (family X)